MNDFIKLKREYGKIKVNVVIWLVISIPVIFIVIMIIGFIIAENINDRANIELNSDNQYYIADVITENDYIYEVDFNKNKIIQRGLKIRVDDSQLFNIQISYFINYKHIYNEPSENLKVLINKIKANENSKTKITDQELQELYRKNQYNKFVIKDYQNNVYYLKNLEDVNEMDIILQSLY